MRPQLLTALFASSLLLVPCRIQATDATPARFLFPFGIAVDGRGFIFVADSGNHTIRCITPDGHVRTIAGKAGVTGTADGVGSVARFHDPRGLVIDSSGNLLVADTVNHAIRRIDPTGRVTTLAGHPGVPGSLDGPALQARFNRPTTLAIGPSGAVYVADSSNHTVRMITRGSVTTIAGRAGEEGTSDGPRTLARFRSPYSIAVDRHENVWVGGNGTLRRIDRLTGQVTTVAGSPGQWDDAATDGLARTTRLGPTALLVSPTGDILIVDSSSETIRKLTRDGRVELFLGRPRGGRPQPLPYVNEPKLEQPSGLAMDRAGSLYITDVWDQAVYRFSAEGSFQRIAGVPRPNGAGSEDGIAEAGPAIRRVRAWSAPHFSGDASASGRFRLWQEDCADGRHALHLRNRNDEDRVLLEFAVHVDVRWIGGDEALLVEDFGDGRRGGAYIFYLNGSSAILDLRSELLRQMEEPDRDAILKNESVFILATPIDDGTLTVSAKGSGALDPKGFWLVYSYTLGGTFIKYREYSFRSGK